MQVRNQSLEGASVDTGGTGPRDDDSRFYYYPAVEWQKPTKHDRRLSSKVPRKENASL